MTVGNRLKLLATKMTHCPQFIVDFLFGWFRTSLRRCVPWLSISSLPPDTSRQQQIHSALGSKCQTMKQSRDFGFRFLTNSDSRVFLSKKIKVKAILLELVSVFKCSVSSFFGAFQSGRLAQQLVIFYNCSLPVMPHNFTISFYKCVFLASILF